MRRSKKKIYKKRKTQKVKKYKQKGGDNKKKILVNLIGGLGNRIFQIFAGAGFAEKWNMDLYVLKEGSKWEHKLEEDSIDDIKKILPNIKILDTKNSNINYKIINDNNIDINVIPDTDVILDGYFQKPSLFPTKPILLNLTEPQNSIIKDNTNLYFIHIRLGDYEYTPRFTLDLVHYYKICINKIKQHDTSAKFLIVSNDINKAKEYIDKNLKQDIIDPIFDDNNSRLDSLYYMSKCKGGICANSTFSWFGAYSIENKNKDLIFMPFPWSNDKSENNNYDTSIYPNWVTIINIDTL